MSDKKLESEIAKLQDDVAEIHEKIHDIEVEERIKRILKDQEKGTFKYLLDTLKVIAAIIFLATAGGKATDIDWIKSLVD